MNNVFAAKGVKFSQRVLNQIDFHTAVLTGWTTDAKVNNLVMQVVSNYNEKSEY